jgi:hypothetical protein
MKVLHMQQKIHVREGEGCAVAIKASSVAWSLKLSNIDLG